MKIAFIIAFLTAVLLMSCNSEPSLQKYFVENSEKKDFIALDISSSILNLKKTKLSAEQSAALKSFDKMNIIAFQINDKNKALYEAESLKVSQILEDEKYQELMKVGSGKDAASVSFVGDENNINEFILFAKKKDNGFAVVRILGKDMNPNNIMTMLSVLQSADIDMEQLKPLQDLMK
jgi:hypothetical protein